MGRVLETVPLPGYDPEIGRWLWAMEEVRRSTTSLVRDLPQEVLDWEGPEGGENAIGSLLYHIALIEMSWLFLDVLERDLPPSVAAEFPHPATDPRGRLIRVRAVPPADHLARLSRSRAVFLEAFRSMSLEDWRRVRSPGDVDYGVTPEWAVFHLVEHEAGHLYQIRAMRARAASRAPAPARQS
jgi:hypothetical protein